MVVCMTALAGRGVDCSAGWVKHCSYRLVREGQTLSSLHIGITGRTGAWPDEIGWLLHRFG